MFSNESLYDTRKETYKGLYINVTSVRNQIMMGVFLPIPIKKARKTLIPRG